MSHKTTLNQMSKRQILENLLNEQNQGNITLSRLVTAVAVVNRITPEALADIYLDNDKIQAFINAFNTACKIKQKPEDPLTNL